MGPKSASPAEASPEATVPDARERARQQPLEGLLERLRAIAPLIAGRARNAERERKPDDDVIEALEASGVFRSFVPRRFGGYEIGLDLFVDIGVAVSEACPSTGWITTFYMEHNWLLTHFSDELQRINRDVQMMGAHTVFDVDLAAEQCGRARLESDVPLFPRS